jgi:hypothetical protein
LELTSYSVQLIERGLVRESLRLTTGFSRQKSRPKDTLPRESLRIGFDGQGKSASLTASYQSVDVSEYSRSRSICHACGDIGREATDIEDEELRRYVDPSSNAEAMALKRAASKLATGSISIRSIVLVESRHLLDE